MRLLYPCWVYRAIGRVLGPLVPGKSGRRPRAPQRSRAHAAGKAHTRSVAMQHNRMFPYLAGGAVVAAVLIAVGAPLTSLLPFVLVLACPLMMVFMMRGMSGTRDRETTPSQGSAPDRTTRK